MFVFLRRETQIRRELITAESLFLQQTVNGGESDCHSLSLSHCHLAGHQGVLSSAAYFCEEGRVAESDHINADLPGLQTHARCKALFAQSFRLTNPSQASFIPTHNNNCSLASVKKTDLIRGPARADEPMGSLALWRKVCLA